MKFALGITFALASAVWATPIPIWGSAGVGSPGLRDLCVAEQPCDEPSTGGIRFSDNGPGREFYSTPPPVGNFFDLSYDLMVRYDCCFYDLFVSNGSMIAAHLGYPNSYPQLGMAMGHIQWTAKPIEIVKQNPCCYTPMQVVVPIVVSGYLQAWTAEERASGKAPFFDYQITGTGTLDAFFDVSPYSWDRGDISFSGSAEQTPEPATWLLALGPAVLLLRRIRFAAREKRAA